MAQPDPIDIGAAFTYATSDPNWWKKMLVAGLCMFVPLLGWVVLFGWMRDIFLRVREGRSGLPDIHFMNHMSLGWAPLVAILNSALISVPMVLPALCGAGLMVTGAETDNPGLESLGVVAMAMAQLFIFVGSLALNFLMVELWRRGFHGEMGPALSFGSSLRHIKNHFVPCLMVFVGFIAANLVGVLGIALCYLGMFLTLPFAYVVQAHLIAQWDALVSGAQPPTDEEWVLATKT